MLVLVLGGGTPRRREQRLVLLVLHRGPPSRREQVAGAIDEAAYGPDHSAVATDLHNLAAILRELGDLEGARPLQERALAITEARSGADQ